jgi:membrane-bound ClpP family serine protease
MRYAWPVILQILAFGVAFAEIMFPSFGLLAVLCLGLGAYSWYYIATQLPHGAALGFGIADLILIPVAIKMGFAYLGRSSVSHGSNLGAGSGLEDSDRELARFIGQTAVVDAPLRPTGKIRVASEIFEAQTSGDFVDRGALVRVKEVAGSRMLVEKI